MPPQPKPKPHPALKIVRPDEAPMPKLLPLHTAFLIAMVQGPVTDQELGMRAGKGSSNARGRRRELIALGYVENSGLVRKSSQAPYHNLKVWRLTAAGLKKARQLQENLDASPSTLREPE